MCLWWQALAMAEEGVFEAKEEVFAVLRGEFPVKQLLVTHIAESLQNSLKIPTQIGELRPQFRDLVGMPINRARESQYLLPGIQYLLPESHAKRSPESRPEGP